MLWVKLIQQHSIRHAYRNPVTPATYINTYQ